MSYYGWTPYVPVAERRAKALKQMEKMKKKGIDVQPVHISGRKIAASFWGKGWCDHMESFSDYANRLPRGRSYVRNGSVCHLEIQRAARSRQWSAVAAVQGCHHHHPTQEKEMGRRQTVLLWQDRFTD